MIFILGFGRSGTTWLSDIISKSIGGLILFEPMHPQVLGSAIDFCYDNGCDENRNEILKSHLDKVLKGQFEHRWLVRNHLPSPMEGPSDWYVNQVKENCRIAGFKVIRGNFLIDFFVNSYPEAKIIYVRRDPRAVLASIKKRVRFWEEFGIQSHLEKFGQAVSKSEFLSADEKSTYQLLLRKYESDLGKSAIMWMYTDVMATRNLAKHGLSPFSYEDLYFKPYETVKEILTYVGADPERLHPSYIFTPSMLTLKTQHSFIESGENVESKYKELFWDNVLEADEKSLIDEILSQKPVIP